MKSKAEIYDATMKIHAQITSTKTYDSVKNRLWVEALHRIITEYIDDSRKTDRDKEMQSYLEDLIKKGAFGSLGDAPRKIDDYLYNMFITDVIDNTFNTSGIQLTENWRAKATSYVFHIREVVSKAEIIEGLRERIFGALNQLQSEIDRNRTYVESISAVFLTITEAMSRGAKHLEPAVRLVERLAGALSGFSTASIEHEVQFNLPGPEQFGLDDLPSDNASE